MRNGKWALGLIAAVAATVTIVAACGGDDDDGNSGDSAPQIATNKGLLVAARINDLGLSGSQDEAADIEAADGAAAPAPQFDSAGSGFASNRVGVGDAVAPGPFQQAGTTGITVSGYGSATATADSAVIEFYFNRSGVIEPVPFPEPVPPTEPDSSSSGSGSGSEDAPPVPGEVEQITEADLQPVIDALVGAGIPRDNIEFVEQGYKDPYYASATLRVTVGDVNAVDGAIAAADGAAGGLGDIVSSGNYVTYTVSDCAAMERAAMEAAVEDAGERGAVFAEVLGVGLGAVTGASQYSYSAFGDGSCGSYGGPIYYDAVASSGGSSQVEVYASVTITYAMN